MRPPESGGAHHRGRRERGRLESEGVRRQRQRPEAGGGERRALARRSARPRARSRPSPVPPSSAAGAAPPPGSASQRVPDGGRSARSVSSSGADTSVAHAAPHCLIASRAWRRSRARCCVPDPGGHPAGALGLERHDAGDAELDGLLDQPAEALAVSRSHRQRELRRTRAALGGLHLHLQAAAGGHQASGARRARRRPGARPARPAGRGGRADDAARPRRARSRRPAAAPGGTSTVITAGPPPRPTSPRPPPASRSTSPAAASTAGTSRPRIVSMPEKMARPPVPERPRRSPAAARCSRCGGCWRGADRRGRAAGRGRRRRRRGSPPRRSRRCARRCAAQPGSPRRSFSIPTARGGARAWPRRSRGCRCRCPRSSTRSPGRRCRSSRVSAARVEPCSPLPNALSGSSTTMGPSPGSGARPRTGRR